MAWRPACNRSVHRIATPARQPALDCAGPAGWRLTALPPWDCRSFPRYKAAIPDHAALAGCNPPVQTRSPPDAPLRPRSLRDWPKHRRRRHGPHPRIRHRQTAAWPRCPTRYRRFHAGPTASRSAPSPRPCGPPRYRAGSSYRGSCPATRSDHPWQYRAIATARSTAVSAGQPRHMKLSARPDRKQAHRDAPSPRNSGSHQRSNDRDKRCSP